MVFYQRVRVWLKEMILDNLIINGLLDIEAVKNLMHALWLSETLA